MLSPSKLRRIRRDEMTEELKWQEHRMPDHTDLGAMHVGKERPSALEFDADQALKEGLNDVQVYDPDHPTEEEAIFMKNAQSACARCPGHCCLAFTLWFSHGELPIRLARNRQKLKAVQEQLEHHLVVRHFHEGDWMPSGEDRGAMYLQNEIRALTDEIATLEFFEPNLIPITDRTDQGVRTYRCAAFDIKERRCTRYGDRPKLCRKYICGAASAGRVPDARSMDSKFSPSIMKIIASQKIP